MNSVRTYVHVRTSVELPGILAEGFLRSPQLLQSTACIIISATFRKPDFTFVPTELLLSFISSTYAC